MPDKERKLLKVLSLIIVAGLGVSICFSWPDSRHSGIWDSAFFALIVANLFVQYKWDRYKPAPNPLISLFPKTTQQSPESPKH
jgi:hypothetical protein